MGIKGGEGNMEKLYDDIISEFLIEIWNINAKRIIELAEGSAKCFMIDDGEKRYFFKIYQNKFLLEHVEKEIFVCNFLRENGFCVSEFIPTNRGTYIEYINDRLSTLQEYIEGITYHKFEMPKRLLFESIKVLADINIALEELPISLPLRFGSRWIEEWPAESIVDRHYGLLAQLLTDDKYYDKIARDFENKSRMIEKFDLKKFPFSELTFENTHGDYNVMQLILERKKVKAIIDFSSCSKLPICWEIIRSYSLSSMECRESRIDIDNFVDYVKVYNQIRKLKKEDLELMPFFYLFSLLRSTFGYKGYIKKKMNGNLVDEKDKNALEFAFWRTNMAKWLFENSERLSSQLGKCL